MLKLEPFRLLKCAKFPSSIKRSVLESRVKMISWVWPGLELRVLTGGPHGRNDLHRERCPTISLIGITPVISLSFYLSMLLF